MPLNLIKLVVGIDDVRQLYFVNEPRLVEYRGEGLAAPVWTRRKPRRYEELLKGGSLYRVIKNRILCRQKILGLELVESDEFGSRCQILVDPQIILTIAVHKKPFQGWRYLNGEDVPPDRGVYYPGESDQKIPDSMHRELDDLGLL